MKQNYFKTICALLWLIVPMLFYPLQATAQETTLPDEAESVELAIPSLNLEDYTKIKFISIGLLSLAESGWR